MASDACPCGGGRFATCCGRFIADALTPESALELMRSRYTAFTRSDAAYLLRTWHPASRPADLDDLGASGQKWLGLSIKRHENVDVDHAVVEFVAQYRVAGRGYRLHEVSRFERLDGHWLYRDGIERTPAKDARGG